MRTRRVQVSLRDARPRGGSCFRGLNVHGYHQLPLRGARIRGYHQSALFEGSDLLNSLR